MTKTSTPPSNQRGGSWYCRGLLWPAPLPGWHCPIFLSYRLLNILTITHGQKSLLYSQWTRLSLSQASLAFFTPDYPWLSIWCSENTSRWVILDVISQLALGHPLKTNKARGMVYHLWAGDGRDGDAERIENGVRSIHAAEKSRSGSHIQTAKLNPSPQTMSPTAQTLCISPFCLLWSQLHPWAPFRQLRKSL